METNTDKHAWPAAAWLGGRGICTGCGESVLRACYPAGLPRRSPSLEAVIERASQDHLPGCPQARLAEEA